MMQTKIVQLYLPQFDQYPDQKTSPRAERWDQAANEGPTTPGAKQVAARSCGLDLAKAMAWKIEPFFKKLLSFYLAGW